MIITFSCKIGFVGVDALHFGCCLRFRYMGCRGDSSKAEGKQKNTLECVIPFPGQADSWDKADQKRRYNIPTAADKAVITTEQYNRGCFFYPQSIHGRQSGCGGLFLQRSTRRYCLYGQLCLKAEQNCNSD